MIFPRIIPWYSIYTDAVDAVWLTAVVLRHAAVLAAAAAAATAVLRAEDQCELLRFDVDGSSAADDSAAADDDDKGSDNSSVATAGTVDSAAPFSDHLNSGARRVFGVPRLRPRQDAAIQSILFDDKTGERIILVERTGGGRASSLR